MSVVSEFKTFIARGSVIDLAVGVVVGAAFGKIVDSLVKDVVTPPLGLLIGGVDFTDLKISIGGLGKTPVTVNYGVFLQSCFNFLIIAFAIFLLVKAVNVLTRKPVPAEPAVAPPPSPEALLLAEIRDELRRRP
ncbi:MAG TPA: large-conductance mechanosensitive channel protein MscL [Fibrobacteria bacterium]|jgi:large conductance mechanosensitive channel|nr:large-conductance mechanosensitive channel protein MscL [Fibrobacteria bacterium]